MARVPRTLARLALPAAAAWLAVLPCAQAADVRVTGRVLPGHLAIAAPAARVAFGARRARLAAVVELPFTVTDTRGNGAGWTIALTATARTARGRVVHGLGLGLRGFRLRCGGCRRPVDRIRYPLALPLGTPTRVFRAARNSGMGVMRLTGILGVTGTPRPATGAIALTVRLAQVSGP